MIFISTKTLFGTVSSRLYRYMIIPFDIISVAHQRLLQGIGWLPPSAGRNRFFFSNMRHVITYIIPCRMMMENKQCLKNALFDIQYSVV